MANAVDLLTLLALPRLGRKTVHKLLPSLGSRPASPENICLMLETLRKTYPGVKVPQLKEVRAARKIAEELRLRCRRLAIRILVPGGKYFPARLETIPDPPVLLFARGHVECLTREKSVAIVGTREPSVFGFRAAKRLGAFFADRGWTVVSGLARGCDTAAHQGCLERGGKTAAFLAHGLDIVYPPENRLLAAGILRKGGCLVSEYAPGMRAEKHHFMERDRLQSGLALGVLVVETDLASGTVHTIHYALAQERVLACLKHPAKYQDIPQIEGNKRFLASGEALPVADTSGTDHFISVMEQSLRGRHLLMLNERCPA